MRRELNNSTYFSQVQIRNLKLIAWHIFGIAFVIAYQIVGMRVVGVTVTFKGWVTYLLQIATFYANFFLIIPIWYEKRRHLDRLVRVSILIFLHILIRGWIVYGAFWKPGFLNFVTSSTQLTFASLQLAGILGLSFFLGLYKLSEKRSRQVNLEQQKTTEALEDKLRIECIMSQLQLSPHYLFSSLNFMKVRSEHAAPDVAKVADLLADILRHTLIDISNIKKVPLSAEIELVRKHIELHEQLSELRPSIDYKDLSDSDESDAEIPPSILLTLSDNVLKYAVLNDPETPARIHIRKEGNILTFHTFNYKRGFPLPGRGRGLNSVRTILRYYYPERHIFNIDETDDFFTLTLTISL